MAIIRPCADLRNNYNEISKICHNTNKPIFITKNGYNDLVLLSTEAYENLSEEAVDKLISKKFDKYYKDLENFKKDIFIKYDEIKKESENGDLELQKQLDLLRKGILSLQKKEFFKECQALLEEDHELTLDEYQQCIEDHDAYNGLKGNHRGDSLFALVEEKAKHISDK